MSKTTPFDRLAERFSRNIYDTPKGQLRLQLLQDDLSELVSLPPLAVLDAGGGLGQISRWVAEQGHRVVLCDAAQAMLKKAQEANEKKGLNHLIELVHAPIDDFCNQDPRRFDLVLCHAVLEWVEDPETLLRQLVKKLAPGGRLSLMFYNQHALVLKNALRGNFRRVMKGPWQGDGSSLTPSNPQDPEQVYGWLDELGLVIRHKAGMRCFFDYLPRKVQETYKFADILEMERAHRHRQPYLHMARYIHLIAERKA